MQVSLVTKVSTSASVTVCVDVCMRIHRWQPLDMDKLLLEAILMHYFFGKGSPSGDINQPA